MISSFLEKLTAREFQMCKCGHTRFWHEGKCLMTMQHREGNEDFDYCQCTEFQLVKSIASQSSKRIGGKRRIEKANENSTNERR
jgi:hypothetical protein